MSRRPPITQALLPLACALAAALLLASQFMDVFDLNAAPGQTFDHVSAVHQHSIAVAMLAVFALAAVIVAVATGSRPAAYGVAIAGVAALLIFLLRDLPDAGKVGSVNFEAVPLANAKTDPVIGFWLELIASLVLAVCGGALATLTPDQLGSIGRRFGRRDERAGRSDPKADDAKRGSLNGEPSKDPDAEKQAPKERDRPRANPRT